MNDSLRVRLSRKLRALMRDNLSVNTQAKVKAKSGVSQASIQRILAHEQSATIDMLEQLNKAFGLKRPEFLLLESDEAALLNEWSSLSNPDKSAVLGYIRVVMQGRNEQLMIDASKPVPAMLQAPQIASAQKLASQDAFRTNDQEAKQPRGLNQPRKNSA